MSKSNNYESVTVKIRKNITPLIEIGRKEHQKERGTLPSYTVFISEILYKELKQYECRLEEYEKIEKLNKEVEKTVKSDNKKFSDEIVKKSIPKKALESLEATKNCTQREAAEKLGISIKTFEGNIERARKYLNSKTTKEAFRKAEELELF